MNLGRSLSFAFRAPDAAPKLLVGGLLTLLFPTVFFGFVVAGYVTRVLCNALEGRDGALPPWKNFASLFSEGVAPLMVVLVYHLPLFLLYAFKVAVLSPDHAIRPDLLLAIAGLALATVGGFLAPAAVLRLVLIGQPKAAFDMPRIFSFISRNFVRYTTTWALSVLCYAAAMFCIVGLVVGLFFGIFISLVISAHLYAQMYRASKSFSDDVEGEARASIALPPPLSPK
jgi:hypothetical protein